MASSFLIFIVGIAVATGANLVRQEVDAQRDASVDQVATNASHYAHSARQSSQILQSMSRITRHAGSHGSEFPIDVVYCWSGEAMQHAAEGEAFNDHNTGGGFGELRYSIRFLEAYAPWFNKAFVLVNTAAMNRPPWLSEEAKDKIEMVDRCSLLGAQDCPTENTAACQAVVHKIPGLSEHFMLMDDDFLLLHPLKPSDFFQASGNPFVLASDAEADTPMYDHTPNGPNMPPKLTPTRSKLIHHVPMPMLVSFASQLEDKYPDWYAFVRSHRTRFICCDASVRGNGLDEEFKRVYPHQLLKLQSGSLKPQSQKATCDVARHTGGEAAFTQCFEANLKNSELKFMTLQNIGKLTTWRIVQKALEEHIKDMPASKLVVAAKSPGAMFRSATDFDNVTFDFSGSDFDNVTFEG